MSLFDSLIPSFSRRAARSDDAVSPAVVEPATARPRYALKETDEGFGLTVTLPGVAREGLELTADSGEIRILGRRNWKKPADWNPVYRETPLADFELVLTHDQAVDVERIHADLKDGVLRVSLPKAEALKPRKIEVN